MDRLDELAIFVAILDAGSLAEAGRRLHKSAPAVTRCLATLEDRLGERLIERTTRHLAPTEAGRRLAERARRLLADYAESMHGAGTNEMLRGKLRITAPVVFGQRHLMPMVSEFLLAYPQISMDVVFSDHHLDLIEQELDLAVRIGDLSDSTLVARRVGSVGRMLVASPAYTERRGVPQSIGDLSDHDVIFTTLRTGAMEWRLMEQGREKAVRLTPRLVVNHVEASLVAARQGLGIARALSYQVADDLRAGTLVRLLPQVEAPPLPIHLVVLSTRHMAARTRIFMDFAASTFKSMDFMGGRD